MTTTNVPGAPHPTPEGGSEAARHAATPEDLDGRPGETPLSRADRNWAELLQELRVTQTGAQILTGFLLTVPLQPRFTELSSGQQHLYVALVAAALLSLILVIAPVSMHRVLFARNRKRQLVRVAAHLARWGVASIALVIVGAVAFVFSVVEGPVAALIAAGVAAVLIVSLWVVLPVSLRRE